MKHKSILSLLIFLMGLGVTTTSCEDMLTPDMNRYSEGFSGTDTVYFYLGIMRNVQDMVEQNQLLGDLRSDLVNTTSYSSDSVSHIINFQMDEDGENGLLNRAAYYKVINQCNFYLAKVDTAVTKNSIYYMKREYAQVVNIRAWAYLQLVQTYGEVPYLTEPVDNADTGWETSAPKATADNLVDYLKKGLQEAQVIEHTLGYPQYGEFATGSDFNLNSSYMRFYADVILGDLYLLRSNAAQGDYVEAAKNYYYFLEDQMESGRYVALQPATFSEMGYGSRKQYNPNTSNWISGSGLSSATMNSMENLTVMPSAANSSFGRVLTQVAQVYGFDAHSTNTTSSDVEGENVTTSGNVSLNVNYRSRQVEPSLAYLNLCAAQNYTEPTISNSEVVANEYYDGAGDARLYGTAPLFRTTEGQFRFIIKDAPTSVSGDGTAYSASFRHYKSISRLKQVYLRYAEAINRAGFPRTAFMILRNGIHAEKLPTLMDSVRYYDVAQTRQTVYYLDSSAVYNAANYISLDELRRAKADPNYSLYIDFSSSSWSNSGIHELGCGTSSNLDTLYSYDKLIPQRIADEQARSGEAITGEYGSASLASLFGRSTRTDETGTETTDPGETTDPEEPVQPDRESYTEIDPVAPALPTMAEINAVETLIADELALETAFEGTRMFDLIRMARHKNDDTSTSSDYGTKWLAWKIARRNVDLAPYEEPSQYDASLFSILLTPANWYIANPVY